MIEKYIQRNKPLSSPVNRILAADWGQKQQCIFSLLQIYAELGSQMAQYLNIGIKDTTAHKIPGLESNNGIGMQQVGIVIRVSLPRYVLLYESTMRNAPITNTLSIAIALPSVCHPMACKLIQIDIRQII